MHVGYLLAQIRIWESISDDTKSLPTCNQTFTVALPVEVLFNLLVTWMIYSENIK